MFNSILRTSEAVTSTQAVALREVCNVYGRGDGSVVALDGVTVGLARLGKDRSCKPNHPTTHHL
jgi:hypothetical protein